MAYGVTILPLDEVVRISEKMEKAAIQRLIEGKHNDIHHDVDSLQYYRDYQVSTVKYLKELEEIKK